MKKCLKPPRRKTVIQKIIHHIISSTLDKLLSWAGGTSLTKAFPKLKSKAIKLSAAIRDKHRCLPLLRAHNRVDSSWQHLPSCSWCQNDGILLVYIPTMVSLPRTQEKDDVTWRAFSAEVNSSLLFVWWVEISRASASFFLYETSFFAFLPTV